jgi:hypothetical protein
MVIIDFKDGTDWFNPNWVFRQLSADIVETFPGDVELHHEMEKGEAFGLLPLDSMEPVLASRILLAMRTVAQETVQGNLRGWLKGSPDDQEGQRMYLDAVSELLEIIRRQPEGEGVETGDRNDVRSRS